MPYAATVAHLQAGGQQPAGAGSASAASLAAPAPPAPLDTRSGSGLSGGSLSPDDVMLKSQLEQERNNLKMARRQVDVLMQEVLKLKGAI